MAHPIRYRATTKRNKAHPVAPNRLKRDLAAERPDQKWLADISYIPTLEGRLYLAAILDLYTRRIVGWAMADRMTSTLTISALEMGIRQRKPGTELIHHSDRGSQYTDQKYQALLESHGIQASMNGVGSWYDNAPMESFFGTLKSERLHHCFYQTREEARTDLLFYIEAFYSRRRLHSALGYLSPEAFEKAHYQQPEYALTLCPQKYGKVKAQMHRCATAEEGLSTSLSPSLLTIRRGTVCWCLR